MSISLFINTDTQNNNDVIEFKKCKPLKQNSNDEVNDANKSLFINTDTQTNTDANEVKEVNRSLLINTNAHNNKMVDFPEDIRCRVKSFKTAPY